MNDSLHYVALGDSITSGNNVPYNKRYPILLARQAEWQWVRPVIAHNLGRSGLSSAKLLRQLRAPSVHQALRHAAFVTVCIGGDDLIYAYIKWRLFHRENYIQKGIIKLFSNYEKLCRAFRTITPAKIVLSTFYNPFPRSPLAVDTVAHCNYEIIYPLAAQYGFPIADLYAAFHGREHLLLAHYRTGRLEDYRPLSPNSPIHPNAHGYHVIADTFADKML